MVRIGTRIRAELTMAAIGPRSFFWYIRLEPDPVELEATDLESKFIIHLIVKGFGRMVESRGVRVIQ